MKPSHSLIVINLLLSSILIIKEHTYAGPGPEKFEEKKILEIKIHGLKNTREYVIRRELRNRNGGAFSYDEWIRERNAFLGLDLFASVALEVQEKGEGIILNYRFLELPAFFIYPTLKQTDQDGWYAGPAMSFINLFGAGVKMTALARSTVYPEKFLATEYLAFIKSQWTGPVPMEFSMEANKTESYNTLKKFNENSIYTEAGFYHRIKGPLKIIYYGGTFDIKRDRKNGIFYGRDDKYDIFLSRSGRDFNPRLGTGIILDTRDRLLNPHRGIYQELAVTQSGGPIGGDSDYREWLFDFRSFLQPAKDQILHLSVLGQYRPGKMGFYDYYNIGGANSIRAYEPDPMLYGRHEFLATVEYRFEIVERFPMTILDFNIFFGIQLVFGSDYAVLWNDGEGLKKGRSFRGYYTGIHILVPGVDRFRIEYGFHDDKDRGPRIEFALTIGIREKSLTQRNRVR